MPSMTYLINTKNLFCAIFAAWKASACIVTTLLTLISRPVQAGRVSKVLIMRFWLLFLFSTHASAAETILYASIPEQADVEISEEMKNRCEVTRQRTPDGERELMIDCRQIIDGPLHDARYLLDAKATSKHGEAVFQCVEGCGRNKARRLRYVALDSGC